MTQHLSYNSPITPQTPIKDRETPNIKSIRDFTIDFHNSNEGTIENAEANSSEKYTDTVDGKVRIESFKTFCKILHIWKSILSSKTSILLIILISRNLI